jgi:hypothetical protein
MHVYPIYIVAAVQVHGAVLARRRPGWWRAVAVVATLAAAAAVRVAAVVRSPEATGKGEAVTILAGERTVRSIDRSVAGARRWRRLRACQARAGRGAFSACTKGDYTVVLRLDPVIPTCSSA